MSSSSFRSCLELNELLKIMISDSTFLILPKQREMFLLCKLWTGTIHKDLVAKDVRSSPYFSVLFDKSFNKVLQQSQIEVQLRYWNGGDSLVKTRCYDSQFITKPNVENLASSRGESLTGIPLQKMRYFSMDGPSVNWNLF